MVNQLQAKIIKAIEDSQLSVGVLEKKAGVKKNAIRNIIDGRSKNPTMETLLSIAAVIGCSIDNLIKGNDDLIQEASSPSQINQEIYPWNMVLFQQVVQVINELLNKRTIILSYDEVLDIVKEVYLFSIGKNEVIKTVDLRFAQWFIDKNCVR
jgi:transcriptional regulator with XRE-family HTH domain